MEYMYLFLALCSSALFIFIVGKIQDYTTELIKSRKNNKVDREPIKFNRKHVIDFWVFVLMCSIVTIVLLRIIAI